MVSSYKEWDHFDDTYEADRNQRRNSHVPLPAQWRIFGASRNEGRGVMVLDTACAMSVAGIEWLHDFAAQVKPRHNVDVHTEDEDDGFEVGNNSAQNSGKLWRISGQVESRAFAVRSSGLPGSLPMRCRLGQQGSLGTSFDTDTKTVDFKRLGLSNLLFCAHVCCSPCRGHP